MTERPIDQTTSSEPERPGNATAKHQNVSLLSVATTTADRVTTSADIEARLRGVLRRLRLPMGLLERVAGVTERRNWGEGQTFHEAAIDAGRRAMAEAGVRPEGFQFRV